MYSSVIQYIGRGAHKQLQSTIILQRCAQQALLFRRSCSASAPAAPPPPAPATPAASDGRSAVDVHFHDIPVSHIRNFSIIAHVDHGKSTLADRLLEMTGAVKSNSGKHQILDSLQVEQERGITVKAQTASLLYRLPETGETYLLNLIDTPGHVDFSNEVYRSLAACDGVVLLVDANHGVQAQTVANYHLAASRDLHVVPVLNKVDLRNADPDRVCLELDTLFGIDPDDVLRVRQRDIQYCAYTFQLQTL